MANTAVTGTIVNESGKPHVGLRVAAVDVESLSKDILLGIAVTDFAGRFRIEYSKWKYSLAGLTDDPDIQLYVGNGYGRVIHRSKVYEDVGEDTIDVGEIVLTDADVSGWLVTNMTGSPTMLSRNFVESLIDNKVAFERVMDLVSSATETVSSIQLYFDVKKLLMTFDQDNFVEGQEVKGKSLEDELLTANRDRNVEVKLLMNDFTGFPYPVDTAGVVEEFFEDADDHTVKVGRFGTGINNALHSKMFIFDSDTALMNASPLIQEYWDDTSHSVDEFRRGSFSYGKNAIRKPVHESSVLLRGPCVTDLSNTFMGLWRYAVEEQINVSPAAAAPDANASVQIARTVPGAILSPGFGEIGILEAYLRAIQQAEQYIYIEDQYITFRPLAGTINHALKQNDSLRVIIVANVAVDAPSYGTWQNNLLRDLYLSCEKEGTSNRLGIYTLWAHDPGPKNRIIPIYIHSKAAVVDDKWATIGSANLDGQGLYQSHHLWWVSKSDQTEERAVEVNAIVYNGVDGQLQSDFPANLRRTLFAEHLGLDPNSNELSLSNSRNWVDLWNSLADAKLGGLSGSPILPFGARILKWVGKSDPEDYLKELGVPEEQLDKIEVMSQVKGFDLKKGKWK